MKTKSKIDDILSSICKQAATLLQADMASMWLLDGDIITLRAAVGPLANNPSQETFFYRKGEGLTGFIAQGNAFRGSLNDMQKNRYWRGKYDAIVYDSGVHLERFLVLQRKVRGQNG